MAWSQNIEPISPGLEPQHPRSNPSRTKTQVNGTRPSVKRSIFKVGTFGHWFSKGRDKALSVWHKQVKDSPRDTPAPQTDHTALDESFYHVPSPHLRSERYEEDVDGLLDEKAQEKQRNTPESASNLALKLRQISRHRARVYHEKIGMQEQSRLLRYKRGEATKAAAILDQELVEHPADSSGFDAARVTYLVQKLRRAFDDLAVIENEFDYLNGRLTEQERSLKDAEDHLYRDLTGEELVSGMDILGDILDQISLPVISPHLGPNDYRAAGHDINDIENGDYLDEDELSLARSDFERADAFRIPWVGSAEQPKYIDPVPTDTRPDSSSLYDMEPATFNRTEATRRNSTASSDTDTCYVGLQFGRGKPEFGNLQDELGSTSDLVLQKRKDDLNSVLNLESDSTASTPSNPLEPASPKLQHGNKTVSYTLAQKISNWMPPEPRSWLEFSYFIFVNRIEELISKLGYVMINSFIRRNWSCDKGAEAIEGDGSIQPSVSSLSDDVPLYMQQIVIHDPDGDAEEVDIFQLSRQPQQPDRLALVSNTTEPRYSARPPRSHSSSSRYTEGRSDSVITGLLRRETSRTDLALFANTPCELTNR